jgi:hypothetical protein
MLDLDSNQGTSPFHACPVSPTCPYCISPDFPTSIDWSSIEAAYCISLREREDRVRAAEAQFHRVGLCRRVVFYRPTRHPSNPIAGIWESHRAVLSDALRHGCRSALVFEDDVVFSRRLGLGTSRALKHVIEDLPADWNILYLGHWPMRIRFISAHLVSTSSACTHAYLASERLMRFIVDRPYTDQVPLAGVGRGIDSVFARLPHTYAYFPMLAVQSTSPSDHFPPRPGRKFRKFSHIVTRTRAREWLLSNMMRPAEILQALIGIVVLISGKTWGKFRSLQSGPTSPI